MAYLKRSVSSSYPEGPKHKIRVPSNGAVSIGSHFIWFLSFSIINWTPRWLIGVLFRIVNSVFNSFLNCVYDFLAIVLISAFVIRYPMAPSTYPWSLHFFRVMFITITFIPWKQITNINANPKKWNGSERTNSKNCII